MKTCKNGHSRGCKVVRIAGMVIAGLVFATLFALVFGYLVKYLWNWLMPGLFGFKTITFIQAFALIIISKILFSGIGHHGGGHSGYRGRGRCEGNFHHGRHPGFSGDERKYFHRFWEEEGKAAFGEYIKRMDKSGCCDSPECSETGKS